MKNSSPLLRLMIAVLAALFALATHAPANGFPTIYWLGSNGTAWTAGDNWSSTSNGTTPASFSANNYIVFSAITSTNSSATDLGGDQTISSLTINTTAPVGISGGNLTVSGATTINTGTLTIGNGGTTGALIGDITNNATLAFNRSNNSTYSGEIDGTGNVDKLGNGTLILVGNNTYSGGTTINAGTLEVTTGGSINSTSDIIAGTSSGDNGTLHINGGSVRNAAGSLGIAAGSVGTAIATCHSLNKTRTACAARWEVASPTPGT